MAANGPFVHALIMCDFIYRDTATGKCYLLGTFQNVKVKANVMFPVTHSPLGIYLVLSHWVREQELAIQIARDPEGAGFTEVLAKLPPINVPAHQPDQRVQFGLNLPPISLPAIGRYSIQALVREELLHQFEFEVSQFPAGDTKQTKGEQA